MTTEQRIQFVRRTILDQVKSARSYLLPDSILVSAVKIICDETELFIREQIKWLEAERMIVQTENELGIRKWKITDLGRTVET